jgi:hypothetical protein
VSVLPSKSKLLILFIKLVSTLAALEIVKYLSIIRKMETTDKKPIGTITQPPFIIISNKLIDGGGVAGTAAAILVAVSVTICSRSIMRFI